MNCFDTNSCPKCHFPKMKNWAELNADQQFIAERLPASVEYTKAERKKHRFCEQCWFEDSDLEIKAV